MGRIGKKKADAEKGGTGILRRVLREKPWIFRGIVVSLIFSVVFSCFYGVFRSRAEQYEESPLEEGDHIAWLCQNCYLLYRDLCNAQSEGMLGYSDIYLEPKEGYQWILDDERMWEYRNLLSLIMESGQMEEYEVQDELSREWLGEALSMGILSKEQIDE